MTNVVPFSPRSKSDAAVAKTRLEGIWSAVEACLSQLDMERLTPDQMARLLRIFDTANECIRIVLSDFGKDPAINQLIDHSHDIKALIATARERLACLPGIATMPRFSRANPITEAAARMNR